MDCTAQQLPHEQRRVLGRWTKKKNKGQSLCSGRSPGGVGEARATSKGLPMTFRVLLMASGKVSPWMAVCKKYEKNWPSNLERSIFRDDKWLHYCDFMPEAIKHPTWFALSRSVMIISISSALGGERKRVC